MSQWVHINASIRYDSLRLDEDDLNTITSKLGQGPQGSEGGLNHSIWTNSGSNAIAAYTVNIFGDLRDFDKEDINDIKDWFAYLTLNTVSIRSAIMEIDIEYSATIILTSNGSRVKELC